MNKKAKKTLFLLDDKIRTERIFRYTLIICAIIVCIVGTVLLSDYSGKRMAGVIALTTPILCGVIIYFGYHFSTFRISRWLKSKPKELKEEIEKGDAVVTSTPLVIVPYSQIVWIYIDDKYYRRGVTLVICCKDGKRFRIEEDPYKWLKKIAEEVPGVLVGIEYRQHYFQKCPNALKKHRAKKIFWGVILLLWSAFLVFQAVLNQKLGFQLIVILPSLIGGIYLLWQAKKY